MKNKVFKLIFNVFFFLLNRMKFGLEEFNYQYISYLLKTKKLNKNLTQKKGYSRDNTFIQYIPDRYSNNLENYQKINNFLDHKDILKWTEENFTNNSGDLTRFYFLNLCIDCLLQDEIIGNVAELGVYKGNSAYLLAKYSDKRLCS